MSIKPQVFIGSTQESLRIIESLEELLSDSASITLWNEVFFDCMKTTIESLDSAGDFDFGVFIMTGDDIVIQRGVKSSSPRDNLLLEFGLFMGRLGRSHAVIIQDEGREDLDMPTDLLGVTVIKCLLPTDDLSDKEAKDKLQLAALKIARHIKNVGKRVDSRKEIPALYRMINTLLQPHYECGKVLDEELHANIASDRPEFFYSYIGSLVRFIEQLIGDYVQPFLTLNGNIEQRLFFAYYLGDGIRIEKSEFNCLCDVSEQNKPFEGEFSMGISNPRSDSFWRLGRAIPGFVNSIPQSNCASAFASMGDMWDPNVRNLENYSLGDDERAVYTVPVIFRDIAGQASIGLIAISSNQADTISPFLRNRVHTLAQVVGFLFSKFASRKINQIKYSDASPPTRNRLVLGCETSDVAFQENVVALRRHIASYFETQLLGLNQRIHRISDDGKELWVSSVYNDIDQT